MVQESTKMDTLIDPSGDTLRTWMGIGEGIFYGDFGIAVMTMSFCFPGVTQKVQFCRYHKSVLSRCVR